MRSVENAYVHSVEFSTKKVSRDGEKRDIQLATMWVNIDRSRRVVDGGGKVSYNNDKGFWTRAEMWGPGVKHLQSTLRPGASVMMAGRYDNNSWTDKDDKEQQQTVFVAEEIALLPRSIESVAFKQRKQAGNGDGAAGRASEAGTGAPLAEDDPIPI